jgi:anhydro-N-acetylmuramic acid kinase
MAGIKSITHFDIMATLNRFTAVTIAGALKRNREPAALFLFIPAAAACTIPLLMEHIQSLLPGNRFFSTGELQVNPDAKEALLFAVLANECVAGESLAIGKGNQDIPAVSMGKISFPL